MAARGLDADKVRALVAPLTDGTAIDIDDVIVNKAGDKSVVKVVVDSDQAVSLDEVADLSRSFSAAIDTDDSFGSAPFTLEVTTPGIDRPLTAPRHWRRAQARKVAVTLNPSAASSSSVVGIDAKGSFQARVGALADDERSVTLVSKDPKKPSQLHTHQVNLADVAKAVVQVDFSTPSAAEIDACGGVPAGRVAPGEQPDEALPDLDTAETSGTDSKENK